MAFPYAQAVDVNVSGGTLSAGTVVVSSVSGTVSIHEAGTVKGFETFTVAATAGTCTFPSGAKGAFVTVESADVRFRDDGTAPTASVGHKIASGSSLNYPVATANLMVIATSGTATVFASYYA